MTKPPIKKALAAWLGNEASFEVPREEKFGDLSTNLAMRLAKEAKKAPRAIAEEKVKELTASLPRSPLAGRISKITVEGPGFINFYFSDDEVRAVLEEIRAKKSSFGKPETAHKKILL